MPILSELLTIRNTPIATNMNNRQHERQSAKSLSVVDGRASIIITGVTLIIHRATPITSDTAYACLYAVAFVNVTSCCHVCYIWFIFQEVPSAYRDIRIDNEGNSNSDGYKHKAYAHSF